MTNPATIEAGFVRFTAPEDAQLQLGADTYYFVHLTFSGSGTPPQLRTTTSNALDSGTATGWDMDDFRYHRASADAPWQSSANALKISINEVLNPRALRPISRPRWVTAMLCFPGTTR